jgi:hypothetical protein
MLKKVVLHLARTQDHPDGSSEHGYDFVAPLKDDGEFDVDAWEAHKEDCTVHRFWAGEGEERGHLVRTRGGRWAFSYAPGEEDDEPIFKFLQHRLADGEYISITEHDGVTRPFRVVAMRPYVLA